MYYGQDGSCNYDTGSQTIGALTSPSIAVGSSATLSFEYLRQVESHSGSYDRTYVEVSYDNGASWSLVWYLDSSTASSSSWQTASVNLSPSSSSMRVRFVFDSRDKFKNTFTGWLVDDVTVN